MSNLDKAGGQGDADARVGGREWVRARLQAPPRNGDWSEEAASRELIDWLYAVVNRRAAMTGARADEHAEIAQDAMTPIVRNLLCSRDRYARAENPAAMLECVASRAVDGCAHRVRMAGLGGVPANGQHWFEPYPQHVRGEAARRAFHTVPEPIFVPNRSVDDVAGQIARWVFVQVGLDLSADAVDGVIYVLERLVAGVSRPVLLRGARSALRVDPAMRHLGFTPSAASAFGTWLLGRNDARHNAPSVIDLALDHTAAGARDIRRWRRTAERFGFASAAYPSVQYLATASDGHDARCA